MLSDFKSLEGADKIFQTYSRPWFFCGGWAVDLFLGKKTREHSDIEIGGFRKDQSVLQQHLHDWKLFWLHDGEKHNWLKDVYLESPVHEIWANAGSIEIELLLNDGDKDTWVYRRKAEITMPVPNLIMWQGSIPFLCPEVALLYKSKNIRPKDQQDFELCAADLTGEQKKWLKESLGHIYSVHQWIELL